MFEDKPAYEQVPLQGSSDLSDASAQRNVTDELQDDGASVYIRQRDAADDLRVVSWPQGKSFNDARGYYYYLGWERRPIVYIIDGGLDTNNQVSSKASICPNASRIGVDSRVLHQGDFNLGIDRWLYTSKVKSKRKNTPTDDNPNSHGSCVLSKAIGTKNGVYKNSIGIRSKNSDIVVVKLDDTNLGVVEPLEAFDLVYRDIVSSGGYRPPVVIFSILSTPPIVPVQHAATKVYMNKLLDIGATIVVPSGNYADKGRPNVDSIPAIWEDAQNFPIVVVGSVDNAGAVAPFSQGPNHVTIWAPGVGIRCARRYSFYVQEGTSASGGTVAGLAAYGLALGKVDFLPSILTPRYVRNWLQNTASWPRQNGGVPVIWNTEQG
ncbi:hypothetical protein ACLMJK_004594 [Lecanora helva]